MHTDPQRYFITKLLRVLLCVSTLYLCLPATAQEQPIKITNWATLSLGAAQKNFSGRSFTSNIDVSWKTDTRFYNIGLAYYADRALGRIPDFSTLRAGIGFARFQRYGGFFIYTGPQLGFARLEQTEAELQRDRESQPPGWFGEPKAYTTFAFGINTALQLYVTPIREFGFSISYFLNTNFINDRGRRYRTIYGLRLGLYIGPHKQISKS